MTVVTGTVDAMDSAVVKPLLRGWFHVVAFAVIAVLGSVANFFLNGGQLPPLPQIQLPGLPQ